MGAHMARGAPRGQGIKGVDGESSLGDSTRSGDQSVAVRMGVAPAPVIPLHDHSLPAVLTISPVPFDQITPVGALLARVPVVVVAVVPVVDADHDRLLRFGFGDNHGWCNNRSSQKKRTDDASDTHG